MSQLNDANTRAAVVSAQERLNRVLIQFAYQGAGWDDYPSMNEEFLQLLRIDLAALDACIEQRLQEKYQTHEPTEFASQEGI